VLFFLGGFWGQLGPKICQCSPQVASPPSPTAPPPPPQPPLGVHCEGPFINGKKKGAHREAFIQSDPSPDTLQRCYGSMDNVRIITLAPELQVGVASLHILCFPPSSSFTSSLPLSPALSMPSNPCITTLHNWVEVLYCFIHQGRPINTQILTQNYKTNLFQHVSQGEL